MAIKYFLYSRQQLSFRKSIEDKMGKVYVPGQVIVGGQKKPFTEISNDRTSKRYSDSKIVAYGEIGDMLYIPPSTMKKVR